MTQSNKFESLLELLINEENDKAEQLFHEIVVEKSRDIYENLADENTAEKKDETKVEAKEDDKKEEVKETEKADEKEEAKEKAVDETKEDKSAEEKIKDEGVFTKPAPIAQAPVEKTDEESIEEIGGDATDELIKDISSDEEGEGDKAADELGQDMDAENGENGEEGSVEDRVVDLEDALDELKAEFEAMMSGKDGDEEAEETALAPVIPAQETQPEMSRFEGKDDAKAETKETVKEYKIQKSADNADHADHKASPVKTGGSKQGGTPVKTGSGAEDKGRPAPTAKKVAGDFANTPGKDKSTSYKKEVKADTKDGADKSAKSPISGK
jgi:hypothetical protein|tara:strand:- start:647 stop:1627 length:981 start_codon:yes stop_codon:yes gene_type:complete